MSRDDYEQRIHRVTDHVRRNLEADLSVESLAKVAHFSPYHFHRIFRSIAGETVLSYVRRSRLERAVSLMRAAPHRSLTSVALEVGFATPSDFSRVFRSVYGCAPSSWDRRSRLDGQRDFTTDLERLPADTAPRSVEVVDRPACTLAYVRVQNPWTGPHLAEGYAALVAHLEAIGAPWREGSLVGLSWDNELATPLDRLTYDLGISVPADLAIGEPFGRHELPAVTAVEIACSGLPAIALAWEYLYNEWLPASGREPGEVPALKRFARTPDAFGPDCWDVHCSIALRS